MEETESRCWFCGRVIPNPKYFITEELIDYGVKAGRVLRSPIHKRCYDTKVEPSDLRFFIKGLEGPE